MVRFDGSASAGCERCAACGKPRAICVCDRVVPLPTRTRVLVLRHPQEDDAVLGTAPLLACSLPSCIVKTGLSWASLARALGEGKVDAARWGVIFPTKLDRDLAERLAREHVLVLDRKGRPRPEGAPPLEGVVVLDGTWRQAKTLWWRNPWLLKLARVALSPREPSIYGRLRKEPRREWVSTLEAVADVLVALGEPEETRAQLRRLMRTMAQRARDAQRRA
jgi:DTW domain-containing protein YfiP